MSHIPVHRAYFGKPSGRSVGLPPLGRAGVVFDLFGRLPAEVSRRLVEGQYLPCRRGAAMPPETIGFRPFEQRKIHRHLLDMHQNSARSGGRNQWKTMATFPDGKGSTPCSDFRPVLTKHTVMRLEQYPMRVGHALCRHSRYESNQLC